MRLSISLPAGVHSNILGVRFENLNIENIDIYDVVSPKLSSYDHHQYVLSDVEEYTEVYTVFINQRTSTTPSSTCL